LHQILKIYDSLKISVALVYKTLSHFNILVLCKIRAFILTASKIEGLKELEEPSMVIHACNPSTWEVKAGELQV
jgi:hypothetical protein